MAGAADAIETFLSDSGIEFARVEESRWAFQLRGERKLTIPVVLSLRAGRLEVESFFMRAPLENKDRFYELLLRRNARSYGVHFAIDGIGDVYVVGSRAAQGVDADELDRIVGAILVESDGLFDAAIEIGFASYLQADHAWRATQPAPE